MRFTRSSRTTLSASCPCAACEQKRGERRRTRWSSSEAFEIKLNKFLSYLHQNQAARDAFMFTLCTRLKDASHRIEVMAHRGAESSGSAACLLRLATSRDRQGRVGRRDAVTVSISHNELAQLGGMSRPHVTVTMGGLRSSRAGRYGT